MNVDNTTTIIKRTNDEYPTPRSYIYLGTFTKETLNKNRAPGQSYDGFITQLVDLWEKTRKKYNGTQVVLNIKKATKDKLDKDKAPDQSHDHFICQLVHLWEMSKTNIPIPW